MINSANALQVDFLKDNTYDIDAVLWIGDVGISGINAVAEILAGKVNPSGSLVDTYCYDNYSSPAMANFTPVQYEGYEEGVIPDSADTYMIYQEGIYVGYKYYETRYEDGIMLDRFRRRLMFTVTMWHSHLVTVFLTRLLTIATIAFLMMRQIISTMPRLP